MSRRTLSGLEPKPAAPAPEALQKVVAEGTQSGGRALPSRTRRAMEARFGHDFRQVRVHTDAKADATAAAFSAEAYTVGPDIVFAEDAYAPDTREGQELLAHELAHVVQQGPKGRHAGAGARAPQSVTSPGEPAEKEAHEAGARVSRGRAARQRIKPSPSPAVVARSDDDDSVWGSIKGAAGAADDWWHKSTSLQPLGDALGGGLDWAMQKSDEGAAKANADAEGHWYSPLMQASNAMNHAVTHGTVGLLKGGGDVVNGLYNTVMHPVDAAMGMEGLAEHNLPMVGNTLKAIHGSYDILSGNKNGEYGNSWGDLANHVLNPLQSSKDDGNYDTDMLLNMGLGAQDPNEVAKLQAQGKSADDIRTDRMKSIANDPWQFGGRLVGNLLPALLGDEVMGEGGAPKGAGAPEVPGVPEAPVVPDAPALPDTPAPDSTPPTQRTPYAPPGVPDPAPFNPDITGPGPDAPPAPKPAAPGPVGPDLPEPKTPVGNPYADWAWNPEQYPGSQPPSTPPGFEGQPRPYPAPVEPSPLSPQGPSPGSLPDPPTLGPERPPNTVIDEPPSPNPGEPKTVNPHGEDVVINPTHPLYPDAGAPTVRVPGQIAPEVDVPAPSAPDTIQEPPAGPKPARMPGDPPSAPPEPVKLPGAPKEGPPIPREEPVSTPGDTQRQPMDIPGVPPELLPEQQPPTQPAPAVPRSPTFDPGLGFDPAAPIGPGPLTPVPMPPGGFDPGLGFDPAGPNLPGTQAMDPGLLQTIMDK